MIQGPTIDCALSRRGKRQDTGPGKQAMWKHFSVSKSGNEPSKIVYLSQNWTSNTLRLRLDRYQPKDTDKQYYSWLDNGVEKLYKTTPYGISSIPEATSVIEKFLWQNSEDYVEAHMRKASEISRQTLQAARDHQVGYCFLYLLYLGRKVSLMGV